ncbi:hypothetical protein ACKU24_015695 [Klebsiella pneumoniae]
MERQKLRWRLAAQRNRSAAPPRRAADQDIDGKDYPGE